MTHANTPADTDPPAANREVIPIGTLKIEEPRAEPAAPSRIEVVPVASPPLVDGRAWFAADGEQTVGTWETLWRHADRGSVHGGIHPIRVGTRQVGVDRLVFCVPAPEGEPEVFVPAGTVLVPRGFVPVDAAALVAMYARWIRRTCKVFGGWVVPDIDQFVVFGEREHPFGRLLPSAPPFGLTPTVLDGLKAQPDLVWKTVPRAAVGIRHVHDLDAVPAADEGVTAFRTADACAPRDFWDALKSGEVRAKRTVIALGGGGGIVFDVDHIQ